MAHRVHVYRYSLGYGSLIHASNVPLKSSRLLHDLFTVTYVFNPLTVLTTRIYEDDFLELIGVKANISHDLHTWYSVFIRHRKETRKYGTVQQPLAYTFQ